MQGGERARSNQPPTHRRSPAGECARTAAQQRDSLGLEAMTRPGGAPGAGARARASIVMHAPGSTAPNMSTGLRPSKAGGGLTLDMRIAQQKVEDDAEAASSPSNRKRGSVSSPVGKKRGSVDMSGQRVSTTVATRKSFTKTNGESSIVRKSVAAGSPRDRKRNSLVAAAGQDLPGVSKTILRQSLQGGDAALGDDITGGAKLASSKSKRRSSTHARSPNARGARENQRAGAEVLEDEDDVLGSGAESPHELQPSSARGSARGSHRPTLSAHNARDSHSVSTPSEQKRALERTKSFDAMKSEEDCVGDWDNKYRKGRRGLIGMLFFWGRLSDSRRHILNILNSKEYSRYKAVSETWAASAFACKLSHPTLRPAPTRPCCSFESSGWRAREAPRPH